MALEAMFHAASENLSTNADAGNLECLAKVLTKPIPLSTDDVPEVRAVLAPANEPQDPQGGWWEGGDQSDHADAAASTSTSANASGQRYARFKIFCANRIRRRKTVY